MPWPDGEPTEDELDRLREVEEERWRRWWEPYDGRLDPYTGLRPKGGV